MGVEIDSVMPLICILSPWLSLAVVFFVPRRLRKLKTALYVTISVVVFGMVLSLLPSILNGSSYVHDILQLPGGLSFTLAVDTLGYYFALISSFIWMVATVYAAGYIRRRRDRFFGIMALCCSFVLGCAFSENMFTYFIWYELMVIFTFPLILHGQAALARSAAIKYLKYAIPASAVLLFAIAYQYLHTGGNLSIVSSGAAVLTGCTATVQLTLLLAYLTGFGVKAAVFPLHGWVPEAHPAAPSPASAVLSGVIIKTGIFGIIRVVSSAMHLQALLDTRSIGLILLVFAAITMLAGMLLALFQSDIKRTLAYSSISQIGFILLGIGCLISGGGQHLSGLAGSLFYIFNHALAKALLFLLAGAVVYLYQERSMYRLGALWRQRPLLLVMWSIAVLSIVGMPLLGGFAAKTLLHHGLAEIPQGATLAAVLNIVFLITGAGTVAYLFKLTYFIFFKSAANSVFVEQGHARGLPRWMQAGMIVLTAAIVVLGVFYSPVLNRLVRPAVEGLFLLQDGVAPHLDASPVYSWSSVGEAVYVIAAGAAVFISALFITPRLSSVTRQRFQGQGLPGRLTIGRFCLLIASIGRYMCDGFAFIYNRIQQSVKKDFSVDRIKRRYRSYAAGCEPLTRQIRSIALGPVLIAVFLIVLLVYVIL